MCSGQQVVGRGDPSVTRSEWHPLRYWCNLDGAVMGICKLHTTCETNLTGFLFVSLKFYWKSLILCYKSQVVINRDRDSGPIDPLQEKAY